MPPRLVRHHPPSDVPAIPAELDEGGAKLWQRITDEFRIDDAGSQELLRQICLAVDRIEGARRRIADEGELVECRGSTKPHPLLDLELKNRVFVARSLARLGLDSEPVRPVGHPPRYAGWAP